MPHVLDIFLGDRPVGTMTNTASDHNLFAFTQSYVGDAERPLLSLSFLNAKRELVQPTKIPQTRLLPFFANLLPEGRLRTYLAERAHVDPVREFPLLWLLGEDLPGAVIVRHPDGRAVAFDNEAPSVSRAIEEDPGILHFSLAGVQLKFSAVAETDGGLTIPARGVNGEVILKMPSPTYKHVPENEFAMMTFARRVGIEVPEIALIELDRVRNLPSEMRTDLGRGFVIKRFDREGAKRIHIEDFNQIAGQWPEGKYGGVSYEGMLANIWRLFGERAARDFIRRLVFTIGIGNGDMHLKNWSVIYRDGRTPEMAPAYDYLSTIVYMDNEGLALSLARSRRWSEMTHDRFERFARKAEVPRGLVSAVAREMTERMLELWPKLRGDFDLEPSMIDRIEKHMKNIPIFSSRTK